MFDRVVHQVWGGDIVDLEYVPVQPGPGNGNATIKTIVNDRVGNVTEYFYDKGNRKVAVREYTGRANPTQPTTDTVNRPTGRLRPNDPGYFETKWAYNSDFLTTKITHPNGNYTEKFYEGDLNPTSSPQTRRNLRITRQTPGSHTPAGDQAVIEEQYEYDTTFGCDCGFNFVTKHTDGHGNETVYSYDALGNRTQTIYRIASILEDFEYNQYGQLTAHIHPDNGSNHRRRDEFTYYTSGHQGGYLYEKIVDANNVSLTTIYEHDVVGNIIKKTDPRGYNEQFIVNELNRVVRSFSREVTDGSNVRYQKDFFYDANNNLIREDIQNIDNQGVLQANTHFTTLYEYELLNFLTNKTEEIRAGLTLSTEYEYDGNRNLTRTRYGEAVNGSQPNNHVTTVYDERDKVFQVVRAQGDPNQSTAQYDYDKNGNLIRTLEGLEVSPHVTVSTYDGYNRLVSIANAMGNTTTYHYNQNHNVMSEKTNWKVHTFQ